MLYVTVGTISAGVEDATQQTCRCGAEIVGQNERFNETCCGAAVRIFHYLGRNLVREI